MYARVAMVGRLPEKTEQSSRSSAENYIRSPDISTTFVKSLVDSFCRRLIPRCCPDVEPLDLDRPYYTKKAHSFPLAPKHALYQKNIDRSRSKLGGVSPLRFSSRRERCLLQPNRRPSDGQKSACAKPASEPSTSSAEADAHHKAPCRWQPCWARQ